MAEDFWAKNESKFRREELTRVRRNDHAYFLWSAGVWLEQDPEFGWAIISARMKPTWHGMLMRCDPDLADKYPAYAGRGISVCDRWISGDDEKDGLRLFCEDMGLKPTAGHSIDRIDNDGNYEPSNCRWATSSEQSRNKRLMVGPTFGDRMRQRAIERNRACLEDAIRLAREVKI